MDGGAGRVLQIGGRPWVGPCGLVSSREYDWPSVQAPWTPAWIARPPGRPGPLPCALRRVRMACMPAGGLERRTFVPRARRFALEMARVQSRPAGGSPLTLRGDGDEVGA